MSNQRWSLRIENPRCSSLEKRPQHSCSLVPDRRHREISLLHPPTSPSPRSAQIHLECDQYRTTESFVDFRIIHVSSEKPCTDPWPSFCLAAYIRRVPRSFSLNVIFPSNLCDRENQTKPYLESEILGNNQPSMWELDNTP